MMTGAELVTALQIARSRPPDTVEYRRILAQLVALQRPETFVPVQYLDDLVIWLRADRGVTLTAAKVSAWQDQSNNRNTFVQGVAADRPVVGTLGGRAALSYDGTDLLSTASLRGLPAASDMTIFVVLRISNVTDGARYVIDTFPNGADRPMALFWFNNFGAGVRGYGFIVDGPQAAAGATFYSMTDDVTPRIVMATQTFDQRSISENGVPKDTQVLDQTNFACLVMDVGGSVSGGFEGELAELIIAPRVMDLGLIEAVNLYLSYWYGIVLP